jgi:hypothetical protein
VTVPRRRRIPLDDESGAVLIFALVIITVVGLVVGALLSFGDTSLRATVALRAQTASAATADGAAQAAINVLKRNTYDNDSTDPNNPKCFGKTATSDQLVLPNLVPASTGSSANSAVVQCTPQSGTGVDGGLVPITDKNKPGQAILTLSQNPAEKGLYVKPLSSSVPFVVHGKVTSASDITLDGGELQANSDVYAHGNCSGTITAPTKVCNGPSVPPDPGASGQPYAAGYTPATVDFSQVATVPADCSGSVVTFSPGYYRDARALTDLTNSNSCKGKVFWFKPGPYYFDFDNTATSSGVSDPHQWVVSVGQLVAGTPTDNTGNVIGTPLVPSTVPGACLNPIDKPTLNMGAQFIFGGDSQFRVVGSADVEICGSYGIDKPPIAVLGVRASDPAAATPTSWTSLTAATVSSQSNAFDTSGSGNGKKTLPAALSATDGNIAAWTSKSAGDSAKLALSPFLPGTGITRGSTINSAQVRIVYGTANAASARSIKVTPSTGAAFTKTVDSSAQGTGLTPVPAVDITSELQAIVNSNAVTGLTVDYSTSMAAANQSEEIDAIYLDINYTPPGLRASSGCAVLPYSTTGGSGCAVISTSEAFSGKFYIQGTTYTPLAAIDISLSNVSEQVMRFGVISRTLAVKETGGFSYTGAVIEVPDNSLGYGLQGVVVYLNVYVCENASTCSTSTGRLRLRAKVYIKDPDVSRQMIVQSWAVQR